MMTIVGLLKGCGVILLYLMLSTTISFCSVLFVVLAISKARKGRQLSDRFYERAVKWMYCGTIVIFMLWIVFGPYRFVQ